MQDLSQRYPVWFCDVWGVVHDGYRPFDSAVQALARHRAAGGTVILVTNSPRSEAGVRKQLLELGVDPAAHDRVVTSGDVTRDLMIHHGGGNVFHLGPSRDLSIFEGLAISRVPLAEARAVLCTGLFDDHNDRLEDYDGPLADMRARELVMICANPDKLVRKGDRLLPCAGALAAQYEAIGGKVLMAGKPFAPIYDLALAEAKACRGTGVAREAVLAIGDGPETDIRGAAGAGFDALLVAEGVTDASLGLAAAEAAVRKLVPEAHIVRTLRALSWE